MVPRAAIAEAARITLAKGALAAALALLPIKVMAEDVLKIGLFNRDAAIIIAENKGFLSKEDLRVEINTVTDSPTLLRNLDQRQIRHHFKQRR